MDKDVAKTQNIFCELRVDEVMTRDVITVTPRTSMRSCRKSSALSVEQMAPGVDVLGGLCIPAHIDRPFYSIFSNLGFLPQGLPVTGVEISPRTSVVRDSAHGTFM